MKQLWIRFAAEIKQPSINTLSRLIDNAVAESYEEIVILMTSGGGTTKLGSAIFNLLRSTPLVTTVYNMGHVESAGVPAFVGGANRFGAPTSKFLLHKASWHLNERLTRDQLAEKVAILDSEHEDYFRIFREVMTCKDEEIHDALHRGRVFTAEDAVKVGLIQEIRLPVIPVGTKIHHIVDAPPRPRS